MLELLTELPRLREPRALPKWLMQVTSHKCVRFKQQANRLRRRRCPTPSLDRVADTAASGQMLLDVEREQALRDAVPACRRAAGS